MMFEGQLIYILVVFLVEIRATWHEGGHMVLDSQIHVNVCYSSIVAREEVNTISDCAMVEYKIVRTCILRFGHLVH